VTPEAVSRWVAEQMADHWRQLNKEYAQARRKDIRKRGLKVRAPDPGEHDEADPENG
jgi:hypothetical protein